MARKLYGNHIEPTCEVCQFGRLSSDKRAVLCPYKGVMPLYHHCRRFGYDPLRRVPRRRPKRAAYSAEDFSID